jgi:hypothetical protein
MQKKRFQDSELPAERIDFVLVVTMRARVMSEKREIERERGV